MRKNMTHYVEFLDMFAPSVVTSRVWNDDLLVEAACNGGLGAFEQLLTVTDEAFILLAMSNYVTRWYAEIDKDIQKVCNLSCSLHCMLYLRSC